MTVSKFSLLQHGENIIIFCNVTKGQLAVSTVLKRISWFKDGVRKQTVRYPDLGKPEDTLGPMRLSNDRSRDGGNYTCLLEMLLRNIKLHFVSESTLIESECSWYGWYILCTFKQQQKTKNKQINSKQKEKWKKENVFIIYKNVAVVLVTFRVLKSSAIQCIDKQNIIINLHVLSLSDFQQ